jgi:hypothetical protein
MKKPQVNPHTLYFIKCEKCNAEGESYYSEELAIFSHNTESWFDDGIND